MTTLPTNVEGILSSSRIPFNSHVSSNSSTSPSMESIVSNIAGKIRYATKDGRKYLIAPLTLIVPGVLAGSQGPLLYEPKDIARNFKEWHGMPLTHFHPTSNDGRHLSANSPEVLGKQGLGYFYDPAITKEGVLKGNAWFDVEHTKRVNQRLYNDLKSGKKIEISSGLYTDNEQAPLGSHYKGKPYTHVARNFRPDHVAILPEGQVGACSIRDGCGVHNREDSLPICNVSVATLKKADFVKFSKDVREEGGTNCGNCMYSKNGYCTYNKEVDLRGLPVNTGTCCAFWDTPTTKREWKELAVVTSNGINNQDSITSNIAQSAEFFATLLHAATSAHIYHFKTTSFACHKAMDELYKKLPKKVDKLVEVWQGNNTIITDWPNGYQSPSSGPDIFVHSLCQYTRTNRKVLGEDSSIQNLVDEVLALLDNVLYELRFLS